MLDGADEISFSALQRAEIAEMATALLQARTLLGFSALQRAEIAEMQAVRVAVLLARAFQCSSTSRNC